MDIRSLAKKPTSPTSPTSPKQTKKRSKSGKRDKRSGKRDKRSGKRDKRSGKRSGKRDKRKSGRKRKNMNEYNTQTQLNQFYVMTLAHLSDDQKGFLDVSDNSVKFTGSISLTELQNMPWMPNLKNVTQKLPIASPLLLGPFTFKIEFSQADKTKEVERHLTIQNGTICIVKDLLLNLKVDCKK